MRRLSSAAVSTFALAFFTFFFAIVYAEKLPAPVRWLRRLRMGPPPWRSPAYGQPFTPAGAQRKLIPSIDT